MKLNNFIWIFIFSIIIIGSKNNFAQEKLNENQLKEALTNIFSLSKGNNYAQMSKKLLNDEGKELGTYNPKNKKEIKAVKRISKKIKAYLNLSDSYAYESISYENYKELPSAEIKVNFRSGDQELTISFIFVEISGSLLLADFK